MTTAQPPTQPPTTDSMSPQVDYQGPERRKGTPMVIEESWTRILAKFGLGGGIALFLVYQLAGDIKTSTKQTADAMALHVKETSTQNDDRDRILKQLSDILLQQCLNATPQQPKKDACFSAKAGFPVRDPR